MVMETLPDNSWVFKLVPFALCSNVLLLLVFVGGNIVSAKDKLMSILTFPFTFIGFLIVNMGMSLYMALGIVEGYLGKKSEFVRTPKFNITGNKEGKVVNSYIRIRITPLLFLEFLFFAYGVFQIVYHLQHGNIPMLLFASAFAIGFGYNVFSTLYHSRIHK
jgi:hypothetical protein